MEGDKLSADRLLIVGTGAMACLFGAGLAEHVEVILLGTWEQALQAISEAGIQIERNGALRTASVRATSDPTECHGVEQALVLVKAWQTEKAARQLAACLSSEGVALSLQNGLGNREILEAHLGVERVGLGVTTSGATLVGPGRIRPSGNGKTHLAYHPRLEGLLGLLKRAGFDAEFADDVEGLQWGKVVINAGINALTAILSVPNGELLERREARQLMEAAAQEAARVAWARGVELPFDDPAGVVAEVARDTASNRSSMLQDISRGAPTEVDAINGAVVRHGRLQGVSTPVNETLWRLVLAMGDQEAPAA